MFNLIMFLIVEVGALDWLCIGLFQFDFIAGLFGSQAHFVSRFLYVIVGLAAVYLLIYASAKKGKMDFAINLPKKEKKEKSKEEAK